MRINRLPAALSFLSDLNDELSDRSAKLVVWHFGTYFDCIKFVETVIIVGDATFGR